MRRLSAVALALCLPLLAQFPLSRRASRAATAAPGAPAVITFLADPLPDGGDTFDVVCPDPRAVVTLVLPSGTEVTAANAESQGIAHAVLATGAAPAEVFALTGTHTLFTLGAGSLPGEYRLRIAAADAEVPAIASYQSSSAVRAGLAAGDDTVPAGAPVNFTAAVFDGPARLMDASLEVAIFPRDNFSAAPLRLPLLADAFKEDIGEGMFGAVWTPDTPGRYLAVLTARGNSSSAIPYLRTATTEVRVTPPLASLVSVSDAAVDNTGDGIPDLLDVSLALKVQTEGRYRLAASLSSPSAKTVTVQRTLRLAAGDQTVALSFLPSTLALLGEDGPYARSSLAAVFEDDPEPPLAAALGDAGPSAPYSLAMFAPKAPAVLRASASRLSFGPVAANASKDLKLTLVNPSAVPVTETRATFSDRVFTLAAPALPFTVPASGSLDLTVRFTPTSNSSKNAILAVAGNQVLLDGLGAAATPSISVAPTALDFGSVAAGQNKSLSVIVRNNGANPLNVSAVTSSSALYTLPSLTIPFTVAPGAQRQITVRFAPTAAGTATGSLTIRSDDPRTASVTVSLTGRT